MKELSTDPASLPARCVAAVVDLLLCASAALFVYLIARLFELSVPVLSVLLVSVFAGARLVTAGVLDPQARGTPGRLLCSLAVVRTAGGPVGVPVAVLRRLIADLWVFLPLALAIPAAAWRAGAPLSRFQAVDWVVVVVVWLDLSFLVVLAVRSSVHRWVTPHDLAFSTVVSSLDRGFQPQVGVAALRPLPDELERIPAFDGRLKAMWKELLEYRGPDPGIHFGDERAAPAAVEITR